MEKISCFLTLNHTRLSQPYIKSIDFLRDEGENKQNMLIFVSGCSTPLNLCILIFNVCRFRFQRENISKQYIRMMKSFIGLAGLIFEINGKN